MSNTTRFIAHLVGSAILSAVSVVALAVSAADAGPEVPYYLEFARSTGALSVPPPLSQQVAVANPELLDSLELAHANPGKSGV